MTKDEALIILGVSQNAKLDDIREAYRGRIRLVHPDHFSIGSSDWENASKMQMDLNEAYSVLKAASQSSSQQTTAAYAAAAAYSAYARQGQPRQREEREYRHQQKSEEQRQQAGKYRQEHENLKKENEKQTEQEPQFSIETVLKRSLYTFFKNPFVFIGLNFLAQIPGSTIMFLIPSKGDLLARLTNIIFGMVIQGTIAFGIYDVLCGRTAQFGKSLSRFKARFIPFVLAVISLFAPVFITGLIIKIFSYIFGKYGISDDGLVMLFVLGLIIFAFLWITRWNVFVPICVLERLSPINSLSRSAKLTKGNRLKIFSAYIPCGLIFRLVATICDALLKAYVAIFIRVFGLTLGIILLVVVEQLIYAIPFALSHITTVLIYYSLVEVEIKKKIGITN